MSSDICKKTFSKDSDSYFVLFCIAHDEVRHAGVQFILDSVIQALDDNPDRRFIYVEIAFFSRWWNEQTDDMKNKVRQFVNEGKISPWTVRK